jgi:hypothetical protein
LLTDSQGQQTGLSDCAGTSQNSPRFEQLDPTKSYNKSYKVQARYAETVDFVASDWSTVSPVTSVTDADVHNKRGIPEREEIKTEIKMDYPDDKSFKKVPNLKVGGQDSAIATFVEHHPGENGLDHYQNCGAFQG